MAAIAAAEVVAAEVEGVAPPDGGSAPEQLVWVRAADPASPASGWRAGELVVVASGSGRQLARVEGVAHGQRGAAGGGAAAVRISSLLALTLGVGPGQVLRLSAGPAGGPSAASAVRFAAAIELREAAGASLVATATQDRGELSRGALFSPGLSGFLGLMLRGAVVIPGQAIAVDWLNTVQLVVAVAIDGGSGDGAHQPAVVAEPTSVTVEPAACAVGGTLASVLGLDAWLHLPPPILPGTATQWEALVVRRVGGMRAQVQRLLGRLHAALSARASGQQSATGHCTLVHGDSGSGKTHLIETALRCVPEVTVCRLDGGQALQPTLEASVAQIANVFSAARREQPSVVLIEELDAMGSDASSSAASIQSALGPVDLAQAQVIARLNLELDELANGTEQAVAVVGLTNRPAAVAASLRRAGRFEVEVEIPPLGKLQRQEVLRILARGLEPEETVSGGPAALGQKGTPTPSLQRTSVGAADVVRLAELAVGFSAGDLAALVREAVIRAMAQGPDCSELAWEHFEAALANASPASLQRLKRGATATSGELYPSMRDLGHTVEAEAVRQLEASILLPLSEAGRTAFERAGLRPSCGALLYGPPGNGKTVLAHAVGRSCAANFIDVHAAELLSPISGESEKKVSALFAQARSAAPAVLFIDELDALTPTRAGQPSSNLNTLERVLSIFLTQLDGILGAASTAPVVVIGATRDIDAVDPAILRSGRIDTHVHVGPPDAAAREAIIRLRCAKMAQTVLSPAHLRALVSSTDTYSRAAIDSLCRESAMRALREDIGATTVGEEHWVTVRND